MADKDGFYARKKGFEGLEGVFTLEGEDLKKFQHVLLEMYKDVSEVMERNNIFYTFSGGCVLGTIRHKGFIPWDDDIDINMPRKDFDCLERVFQDELGEKYTLSTPVNTSGHGLSICQIGKKGTICRSYNELSKRSPGISIDIFILENVPDNRIIRKLHGYRCMFWGYLLTCRKTWEDLPYLKRYFDQNESLKSGFMKKAKLGRMISWISLDRIARKTGKVYSSCKNDHSCFVSIPSGRKHYFGEMYLRSGMCRRQAAEFEGLKVYIPEDTETYMHALYGQSYMQVPPPEKREHHPLMELDFGD